MPGQSRFVPAVVSALSLLPRSDAFLLRPPTAVSCKRSSPALHASFTVGSGGTPTSSSDKPCDDGSADGPVLRPTGTHHPADSMAPLAEAARWSKREGSYFNELIEANGGASVFKAHPGLAFTFLTDSASTEWFFSQPQTVLDRQDGRYFGPHECTEAYIGVSTPPLIANQDESHLVLREYAIEAFRTRVPFGQSAMTHATDAFYEKLWKEGMGEHSLIYNFFLEPMSHFMHEWIFGMGVDGGPPLPPFKDFLNVNPLDLSVLLEIDPDTPAANAAAKAALANRKPSAEVLASVESILDAIRASKVWAGFMDMAKERNVDTTDMEHSFMFSTNFQSAVAVAKNMMPVIAALTLDPDFLEDLRNEIDGKDLTFDSVRDPEGFPLLDSFYWETLRLFPLPAFTVKKVVSDAVVPTSSGKKYQVKKGELLCVEPALGQMDPTVFGPDARDFNPRRFVGNPELKHKVFAYGYIDHDKVEGTQWGCAAHAIGMVDGICKIFYGRWVQEAEWELTSTPVLSADAFVAEVGPRDMSFAKITPRKK